MAREALNRRRIVTNVSDAKVAKISICPTKVALPNIKPVSDLRPHIEVAQIRFNKIGFHLLCTVNRSEQKIC